MRVPMHRVILFIVMEYQVPQFIEVEDKIVGPFTLKQFIYLAGGAGLTIVSVVYLPIYLAILIVIPVVALALALAFYKMNGKPFIQVLEAGFGYYTRDKLFLWRHTDAVAPAARAPSQVPVAAVPSAPRLTRGKLSELAWSLDVKKPAASELES